MKVLKHELPSDHFPINFNVDLNKELEFEKKNDWRNNTNLFNDMENNFKTFFEKGLENKNYTIETLANVMQKKLQLSVQANSKQIIKKFDNINLPKSIFKLIKKKC